MYEDILKFFPEYIVNIIRKENLEKNLEEIRIRANQNAILKFNDKEKTVDYKISSSDILKILQRICENSIYSYQKEIVQGFITVKGGHRVGITGSCIIENRRNNKYQLHIKLKF